MSRRTILHTIETSGPGGAETVLLQVASRLDRDRFRSLALLPDEGWLSQQLEEAGVHVYFARSKGWHDFRVPRMMRRLIRQENIDLIHSHLPGHNFYSCLAGKLAGSRTVATYHGAVEFERTTPLKNRIRQATVRRWADTVVVVCDYVGRLIESRGFPPHKIVRIYNGINAARFAAACDGRLRGELRVPETAPLVGTVANLRESKGYEFFVRAARLVIDRAPETHFVAVGDIDPDLGRPLFALVDELGLGDRLHFLGFRRDVPEILSALNVFVLASLSEGFPLVALEAMAAGKSVVMTRSGGQQEIVEDGRSGLLIPPADAEALAAGIGQLLENPARAQEMACRARARVRADFTLEKMVGEYEKLYDRLIEEE
ncbi:MAG TPA: glycosyltransferase [Patescibacteria group bacterium]|nr:glycosyltransferase [Patescibacteria group bacterium]